MNNNNENFLTTNGLTIESVTNPFPNTSISKLIDIRNKMESNRFADIPVNAGNGSYPIGFEETLTNKKSKESKVSKTLKPIQIAVYNGTLPKETQIGENTIETQINGGGNYTKGIFLGGQSSFIKIRNVKETKVSDKATIVTGTCLGSVNFATAQTETGESIQLSNPENKINSKIESFTFNEKMSIYEIANILEITGLINNITLANPSFDKVVINMPGGSYYLYMMEAFENGFATKDQVFEYFDQVDLKESKLTNSIKNRIQSKIKVDVISYLNKPIKLKIRAYVNSGTVKENFPKELAGILESSNFKAILPQQKITYKDLINGDYTSVYLDQMKGGKSVVAVENIAEENLLKKTLEKATELGLETDNLTGLYILPKVIPKFDAESVMANNKNNLYFLPQDGKLTISNIKKILKFYKTNNYVPNNQI
jgi:hypothetical protein